MNAPFLRSNLRRAAMVFAAQQLDATQEEFLSHRVHKNLVHARALFVWIIRTHRPTVTYAQIGRWLGRDRSTIVSLHQKSIALRLSDADFDLSCRRFAAVWADLKETIHARA